MLKFLLRVLYLSGLVFCGFLSIYIFWMIRFEDPKLSGLAVLLIIMLLINAYLFTGKTGRFRVLNVFFRLLYLSGLVFCGFISFYLLYWTCMGETGEYPWYRTNPHHFGMVVLLAIMFLNNAYQFTRKTGGFRTLVVKVDNLLALACLMLFIPGAPRYLYWLPGMSCGPFFMVLFVFPMMMIFRSMIYLKDCQLKPASPIAPTP